MRRFVLVVVCGCWLTSLIGCDGGGGTANNGGTVAPPPTMPTVVAPPAPTSPAAAERITTIAPFIDDKTVAIGYVDLVKLDPSALVTELNSRLQATGKPALSAEDGVKVMQPLTNLKQFVQQVYMVMSLNELVQGHPPFIVFKLVPGADAKKAFVYLDTDKLEGEVDQAKFDKHALVKGDLLMFADKEVSVLRMKSLTPVASPQLEAAFQLAGEAPIQLLYAPVDAVRPDLNAMLGLMGQVQMPNGQTLLSGIKCAALAIDAPPTLQLRAELQGSDPTAVTFLQTLLTKQVERLRAKPNLPPEASSILDALTPQVQGERLTFTIRPGNPLFDGFVPQVVPSAAAANSPDAMKARMEKLKSLALALHTYHDQHRKFPPANLEFKGKKLLSWRVQILPQLGQQDLYNQFKLDEPWDSPNNLPLVARMPDAFADPSSTLPPGFTTFLAPVNDLTAWKPTGALGFGDMRDGTSNTLFLLNAAPSHAVEWTKPADWEYQPEKPFDGLPPVGFPAVYADGSMHLLSSTMDPKVWDNLLTRSDGTVIDESTIYPAAGALDNVASATSGPSLRMSAGSFQGPTKLFAMAAEPPPPELNPGEPNADGVHDITAAIVAAGTINPSDEPLLTRIRQRFVGKTVRIAGRVESFSPGSTQFTLKPGLEEQPGVTIDTRFEVRFAPENEDLKNVQNISTVVVEGTVADFRSNMFQLNDCNLVELNGSPVVRQSPFVVRAKQAFREGRDTEAFDLLYAEILVGEDINQLLKSMQWSIGLKLPVLRMRWGVAVQYVAPGRYSGSPSPIGRVIQVAAGSQPQNNGGQAGGDPSAPPAGTPGDGVVEYFTGEIGVKTLAELRARISEGQFGPAVMKLIGADPRNAGPNPGGNPGGNPGMMAEI
ncbi:MAG TPA: DUF1559 domain-containing protein, partial [Pirellulaceae bacterium]|nr:DUF1559 domain-containing protein [Pirellulaceae bacterium]